MSRDNERSRLFTRRAFLVAGGKMALFGLLASRIFYLQIHEREKYSTLAEENRVNLRLIAPKRGLIVDRAGVALAINQQNYRVVLLPEQVEKLAPLLDKLATVLPMSDSERRKIERDFKKNRNLNAVMVYDNLTWEQVASLSLRMPEMAGIDIEVGEVRSYPFSDVTAHLIGYVGAVAQHDLKEDQPELSIPGFRIGKGGFEKQADPVLRGETGSVQLEMNARGRVVRELARLDPKAGRDVQLAIDIGLQQMIYKRLETETSASAAVMDIHSGAVYALVSFPGFDPNLFTYGINQTDWDRLNNDEHFPLINKATDGVYSPGSTFKMMTALAALDAGSMKPNGTVFCPGHMDLGKHRFHCWKKGGHGTVDFVRGLAGSCDTYFYEVGSKVGIDKIQAMAKRFGLGQKTGIDLPHERTGLIPSRAWKKAVKNSPWQQGETLITAIGQGFVLTTPMQLAMMTARLVNGGYAVKPHLVRDPQMAKASASDLWPSLGVSPEHLRIICEGMSAVVTQPIGTAHSARVMDPSMAMGGKTGTAQVRRISTAERADGVISNDALPWAARDHALFVGFAPVDNPRYVVSVVVEHGGSGAHIAAPIARDILVECQKRRPEQG